MNHRDLTSPRFLSVLFLVFCLVGYVLPAAASFFMANRGLQIDLDAKIQSGQVVELYVNDYRKPPLSVPIVAGVRHTYSFSGVLENANFLRLDLGKVGGAEVEVYSVTVAVGGRVAKKYGPDVIYEWMQNQKNTYNDARKLADRVSYVQVGYGPSLITTDTFPGGAPPALQWLLPQDRDGILIGFWAAFLVVVMLARVPFAARASTFGLLIGIPAASILAVRFSYAMIHVVDPVDQAVGHAGFNGLSILPNRVAAAATFVTALMLGAFASGMTRRLRPLTGDRAAIEAPLAKAHDPYRFVRGIAIVFVILVLLSFFLAEVYPRILTLSLPFPADWDANNVNFWYYLIHQGFRPLLDFWYPYGGTWVFALPAPWGQLSEAGMRVAVYTVLFLALVRICGILPTVLILYIVLVSDRIQLMWAPWRYLLATNVALTYVVIGDERARFAAGHLLFGAAASLALFFEPTQIIYAAPAVFAKLVLDLGQRKTRFGGALVGRLVREFTIPTLYVLIYFLVISDLAELRAILSFMSTFGAQSYSGATPYNLEAAVQWPFGVGLFTLAAPSALVGTGLYRKLSGASSTPIVDDVLICLGIVGFMLLQKNLIRAADWQFTVPTLLAMLIWLVSDRNFRRWPIAVVGGAAGGLLFWSLNLTAAPGEIFRRAVAAPLNALDSIGSVIRSPEIVAQLRDNAYSDARFSGFPNLTNVAARLRALNGGETPRPIYVIGDTPMLYAVLRQAPPYNTSDYSTSPISEQRRVVDWLVQNQPRFAVWNIRDTHFDAIHRAIRVPLLYEIHAATFVPVDQVGEYAMLRRRAEGEAPALSWWRDRLGATIDYGGLLRRSSFNRMTYCSDAPSLDRCAPYLVVDVPETLRSQRRLAVLLSVGELQFRIEFQPSSKIGTYHVRLDRLWFWQAARLAGLPFHLTGSETPGVNVTLTMKTRNDRVLY